MAQFPDMRTMSMELNSAFGDSAFSEYSRQFKYKVDPVVEVIDNPKFKYVGSSAEGTYFQKSDLDMLFLDKKGYLVGYNPQEAGKDSSKPYLCLTRGPLTPAGYTKLQIYLNNKSCVDNDIISLRSLFMHVLCVSHEHTIFLSNRKWVVEFNLLNSRNHGPAYNYELNYIKHFDLVPAYESKIIPNDMKNWFNRTRLYSWPSKQTRELLKSMGCCYVGVGNSNSPEQDLEWRISPTRQELYLMLNLNPTQFRCYILLKLIKKSIHIHFGDVISSYHCKTALFWTIENNDSDIWVPDNLIKCVLSCLALLRLWVTEKKCPNYFIPEENMFKTKLMNESQAKKLQIYLRELIWCYSEIHSVLLPEIKSHVEIYAVFTTATALKRAIISDNSSSTAAYLATLMQQYGLLTLHHTTFLKNMVSPHEIDIDILSEMLKEKRLCLDRYAHLESVLEDETFTKNDITSHLNDPSKKSQVDHEYCLKLASFAATRGEYCMCDVLLQQLYRMTRINIFCFCSTSVRINNTIEKIQNKRNNSVANNMAYNEKLTGKCLNKLSIKDFLYLFTYCLQFLNDEYEAGIVMFPLNFDLHKTIGIPSELTCRLWSVGDLISIHPMVYMHFLQYKNSGMMNKTGDMCVALEKLEHMNLISLQEWKVTHPDTTLNLLGHIYSTKGWNRLAVQCFRKSWKIQPHYNALKWHVMFMFFDNCLKHEKRDLMLYSKRKRINSVDNEFSPVLKSARR